MTKPFDKRRTARVPCFRIAGFCLALEFSMSLLGHVRTAHASDQATTADNHFAVDDCAIFREGGAGRLFKAPTYWMKGRVQRIYLERKLTVRCPVIAKPVQAFTHDDWVRLVSAAPCVTDDAEIREVESELVELIVESWETPWSLQHGASGWLFRGYFLDKALKKGGALELNSAWLRHCEPDS